MNPAGTTRMALDLIWIYSKRQAILRRSSDVMARAAKSQQRIASGQISIFDNEDEERRKVLEDLGNLAFALFVQGARGEGYKDQEIRDWCDKD